MTDFVSAFKLIGGLPTADKDPDDIDYYGVDIADILAEYPDASVVSVDPMCDGVSVVEVGGQKVRQDGSFLISLFAGGNEADTAVPEDNRCTFRVRLSNGVQRDRSIYFRMVNK